MPNLPHHTCSLTHNRTTLMHYFIGATVSEQLLLYAATKKKKELRKKNELFVQYAGQRVGCTVAAVMISEMSNRSQMFRIIRRVSYEKRKKKNVLAKQDIPPKIGQFVRHNSFGLARSLAHVAASFALAPFKELSVNKDQFSQET